MTTPRGPRLTTVQRRASIVSAAMTCFAERGFSGTTSRMLAKAARVSEALVYRHFPTKRSLYKAIIERKISELSEGYYPAGDMDGRGVLTAIATTLVERVVADPSFMRLMMFSTLEGAPLSDMFFKARVRNLRQVLAGFLQREMNRGTYRKVHAEAAAAAFLGMVFHHIQCKAIFKVPVPDLSTKALVELWVDLFLKGLAR